MSVQREQVIAELVIANRILGHLEVTDVFGHVSARDPDDPERYLLARSRARASHSRGTPSPSPQTPSRSTTPGGRSTPRGRFTARSTRPDVHAVCHNHAHSLLPFGVTDVELRPIFHMAAVIGEIVPVWDIRDQFDDTGPLVTSAEKGAARNTLHAGEDTYLEVSVRAR